VVGDEAEHGAELFGGRRCLTAVDENAGDCHHLIGGARMVARFVEHVAQLAPQQDRPRLCLDPLFEPRDRFLVQPELQVGFGVGEDAAWMQRGVDIRIDVRLAGVQGRFAHLELGS